MIGAESHTKRVTRAADAALNAAKRVLGDDADLGEFLAAMTLSYGAARVLCELRGISHAQCDIAEEFGSKLARQHEANAKAALPPMAQA